MADKAPRAVRPVAVASSAPISHQPGSGDIAIEVQQIPAARNLPPKRAQTMWQFKTSGTDPDYCRTATLQGGSPRSSRRSALTCGALSFDRLTTLDRFVVLLTFWGACFAVSAIHAEPIAPQDIYVLNGNTIDRYGQPIRLVGFDAPEGQHAQCDNERTMAARTAARLRQILARGVTIDLEIIACACPPGTQATQQCNNGSPCGRLTVDGKDVGAMLIAERLAHTLVCSENSCPKHTSWCPS
jgi:endonuclease YncB( thermonuclease family)